MADKSQFGEVAKSDQSLGGIALLADLSEDALRVLEGQCEWQAVKAGEEVISRDSSSRDVIFVVQGDVRVLNYSLSGREVAYAKLDAGGFFGELAAIDGLPRSAQVITQSDAILARLAPDAFKQLIGTHPSVASGVMQKLAQIIRNCDDRIMDLAVLSAFQRVYIELLRIKKPDPVTQGKWMIYPMPTQADIASHASTTRETVARVLGQLSKGGIVERKGKTLYIRDLEKLETLADRAQKSNEMAC